VTTKHRPHRPEEKSAAGSEGKSETKEDYPRPSHIISDARTHHDGHNNYEDEVRHKEKKPNSERKTQEYAQWTTRPTRDHKWQKTQDMRISQPTGKGFNV